MSTDTARGLVDLKDHFLGDTVDTFLWTANADSGGTANITPLAGGVFRLATDGTDGDIQNLFGEVIWAPENGGIVFEARVKLSSLSQGVFIGLSDDNGQDEVPIDDDGGTLTTTASTAVGFIYDSGGNATWDMVSVDDNVDGAQTQVDTQYNPVAGTYQVLRIQVNPEGKALFFINEVEVGSRTSAVDADVLLCPAFAQLANGTAANCDIDYVYVCGGVDD